jgi:hypothetical protein
MIKLGTMVHAITELLTLGNAYTVSMFIAGLFGKKDCGCYQRELFLNSLTCFCDDTDE